MGMLLRRHYKVDNEAVEKADLSALTVAELKQLAKEKSISGYRSMSKDELLNALES